MVEIKSDLKNQAEKKWNSLLHPGELYKIYNEIPRRIRVIIGGCAPPTEHLGHSVRLLGIQDSDTGWSQYIPNIEVACLTCNKILIFNAQFLSIPSIESLQVMQELDEIILKITNLSESDFWAYTKEYWMGLLDGALLSIKKIREEIC